MRAVVRIFGILFLFGVSSYVALGFVTPPKLLEPELGSKALFDDEGRLLALSLSPDEKYRLYTSYEKISRSIVQATTGYEDRHFFSHWGVNPYSLVRGALASLVNPNRPIGGSTLTMQLVRLRLHLNTRSIAGKAQQMLWALLLERHYTKAEILEAYLNLAPYGANIEGVGAASLVYYRKPAKDLKLEEAITLAVLPQHPALRPRAHGQESLDGARERLAANLEKGRKSKIIARDLQYSPADVLNAAPHFFARVRMSRPGEFEYQTYLDAYLQRETEEILGNTLNKFSEYGINNGTILISELPEMKVRAYVGSAGFVNESIDGYVNGLAAERSPGSLLKPFIYALAVDQGQIIPETMLRDVPLRLASYTPENFEHNFLGPISASDALVRSRNIPALELFRTLTPSSFYSFLQTAGVERLRSEEYYGIALVLGGLGVTSEEIAQLYGVLGNSGKWQQLQFLKTENSQSSANVARQKQLFSPEATFLIRDMLSKNPPALVRSTSGIRFRDWSVPWKTGTSYGSKDAWAAGLVGNYVVVVWLGNFDGHANPNLVGRDFAGPVLFSVVDRLLSRGIAVPRPSSSGLNIKKVEVCALTGALPGAHCPHKKLSWFIPGVSPIKTCELHQEIAVDSVTGERMCPDEQGPGNRNAEEKVFEVWDSTMQTLFSRAGMKRNVPPPYAERCALTHRPDSGIRILSPEEHIEYRLEAHRELELELLATTPGDAKQLSWFVNDVLIGQTDPEKPLHWNAKVGHFEVRAADDRGRSSVVHIKIVPQVGGA